MVFRAAAAVVMCLVFLAACRNQARSKEKVEQAILDRLQTRAGLDLKTLDVTTTSVSFDKNMAYATVSFHPKDDPSLASGMVMKYTLQDNDGKWTVVNVGDAQGHSATQGHAGSDTLPPGHPRIEGTPPPAAGGKQ
jgi:hypothetical protein